MKIGLFIGDITRAGGTEKALISLINLFDKEHEFVVFSPVSSDKTPTFYSIPHHVKIFHFNLGVIPANPLMKVKWYWRFYKKLQHQDVSNHFDCIIGYGHSMSIVLSFFKNPKIKLYAYEHADYQTMPSITKRIVKKMYPKLNGIIVLSASAKNNFKHLNKNVAIVPNYISIPAYQKDIAKKNRIIMVGRLSDEKGYERIIPFAEKLKIDFPTWSIDIFGDGPLRNELEKRYSENKLNNVKLHGAVKNINAEFEMSKIFIMTSYTEAMPFVILEAKMFNLPVIAYKNEGTKLLINDNIDGFLVKNNDEESFYNYIKKLIINEDECIEKGLNGKKSLSAYSPEIIKAKWIEIFNM